MRKGEGAFACTWLAVATLMAAQGQNMPVRWQAQYTQLYSDDIESGANGAPGLGPGLQFYGSGSVVTDSTLVAAGRSSIRLRNYAGIRTIPSAVPMTANSTYLVEFKYHVLTFGSTSSPIGVWLRPSGDTDNRDGIPASNLSSRAALSGTFSAGAQTAGASQYVFDIFTGSADADVIIDDIKIFRQDALQQAAPPAAFGNLEMLPFPRLGGILQGATVWPPETRPKSFAQDSADQIEQRLAFKDIIGMLDVDTQTLFDPASIRRLRQLNPNAVILPYRISEEQEPTLAPEYASISLKYSFAQGLADDWYVRDTAGKYVEDKDFPGFRFLNLSPFSPVVNGQTYFPYLLAWLSAKVFPSGLWDGVFLDAFWAKANLEIPNLTVASDPALFNFDYNRNGLGDETAASTNDMTRKAVLGMLQQFRTMNGDLQLSMGNAGFRPELAMAPYLNGSLMECANYAWKASDATQGSVGTWRVSLDEYRTMQQIARHPRITVLEACGPQYGSDPSFTLSPTTDDLRSHRLTLGTALLSDGFYTFDLHAGFTVPLWYDEYSVDTQGNAVEDPKKKGYLGAPILDPMELAAPASVLLQDSFKGPSLPSWLRASNPAAVSVSNGSVILANSNHTQNGLTYIATNIDALHLGPGTYSLAFDWKILDTLDHPLAFNLISGATMLDNSGTFGIVAGDFGTTVFPFEISTQNTWSNRIGIYGGGKVAISNLRLEGGGVGPWRRDFENGFVLVNPLRTPRTFSASELAGILDRTGIHRIKGTQSPEINNGQPVSGDLTVGAFDAIVLLADPILVSKPYITSVRTSGGFPDIAQNGWIEIRGLNLAPPGTPSGGLTWDKAISFASGVMPDQFAGVHVTVNGKPAFVYYVSSDQVNVLTPLEDRTGPAQIVLTSGNLSSSPFTANLRSTAPSLPLVGATNYVLATHADYSLIGPQSLSAPGYPFTPAQAGETIIVYAFGLGLPSTPIVNGSSSQSGTLPVLPQVQIGGAPATVKFAGVISPGLYQVNVTVPLGVLRGDNKITVTYDDGSSPSSDLIAIQ